MLNSNEVVFNSIWELRETLENAPERYDRDDSSDSERGSSWCDTNSYQEAIDNFMNGKMVEGIEKEIERYQTRGSKKKNSTTLDVVGHNVVVPLFLQNVPTCMIRNKKVINNKIINIFYSVKGSCGVRAKELEEGGINLFKKVISLEEQGYRVNLYIIECNPNWEDDKLKYGWALRLKTDREIFNIKKLCYPVTSSSTLRRIGFRIKERLYKDWIGGGYGSAYFDGKIEKEFIKKHFRIQHYELWNYEGQKIVV